MSTGETKYGGKGVQSNPPIGKRRVINIYVEDGKLRVEHDEA